MMQQEAMGFDHQTGAENAGHGKVKDIGEEDNDSKKSTLWQRRRRRTAAGSRTSTSGRSQHGVLSDDTNAFDGFKLRRMLQDHQSSATRMAQWNREGVNKQQQHLPPITSTAHLHRQFSSPLSPSSYDPTRSIGPPHLSPVLSSPRGSSATQKSSRTAVSISGPDGVRVLEPSYPRDSFLHELIAQSLGHGRRDGNVSPSMQPTASPSNDNTVRVHKSLSHQADPSSLEAIAELSRRYMYAPSSRINDGRMTTGITIGNTGDGNWVFHQPAAHEIGASSSPIDHSATRTSLQQLDNHQPSPLEFVSPLGNNCIVSSPVNEVTTMEVHHRGLNENGNESEHPEGTIAVQEENQDRTRADSFVDLSRSVSIGRLARKTFAKGIRLAPSRLMKFPTQSEQGRQGIEDATEVDPTKNLDIAVTTNTTPNTVDESEELSMISLSPRVATRSRNGVDAQQRQDVGEYLDQEDSEIIILQLGHLLGRTCTALLTPSTRERRPCHQSNEDDDDLSTTSSLSSISPRMIVPLTGAIDGKYKRRSGPFLCTLFVLFLCGICSFTIGSDAVLTLGVIAARRSMAQILGGENFIVPTARAQESQDDTILSWTSMYNETELCSNKDELKKYFVGLNEAKRSNIIGIEDQQDTAKERKEVLCASECTEVEKHLVFEGELQKNGKVPADLDHQKNYRQFATLDKLLKAICLHRLTKVRSITRRPRAFPAPPRFWQPGKFAVLSNTSIPIPAELIGTTSRALVHIPSPGALAPAVNTDISNNAVSLYDSPPFSDLYQTLQYNEQTDQDFEVPLSQFLGEILLEYRREKRKKIIEETKFLAGINRSAIGVPKSRSSLTSPLRRLADWLKHSFPFGIKTNR